MPGRTGPRTHDDMARTPGQAGRPAIPPRQPAKAARQSTEPPRRPARATRRPAIPARGPAKAARQWTEPPRRLARATAAAATLSVAVAAAAVLAGPAAIAGPARPAGQTEVPRQTALSGPPAFPVPTAPARPQAGHPGGPAAGNHDPGTGQQGSGARGPTRPHLAPLGGPQLAGHGVIVNYPARGGRPLPPVPASAYVVADAGTGQVLGDRDPHGWYRPASTLKVLTAVTLMPALNPDATVVASHRAAIAEPNKVGLVQGDKYRVSDLFKALLMISANDAAVALAQATGSYARGMAMLNAEAHHLQADDTVAVTPNGLDAPGQHVSAYDEALFARQALAIPAFMRDEALRVFRFPLRPHGSRHHPRWENLWNQNAMLYTFRGDLGGKIGWTTPARATFIGWARRGNTTLVVTILHCRPGTELTYAARLLNWGFAMDGRVRPVRHLVRPRPLVVDAHHRPTATPTRHPVAQLPGPGLPAVPLAAGLGTLLLGVLTGWAVVRVSRRARRAGNLPG